MKLSKHADRTEKLVGIRAEDIHKWIDGLFDPERLDLFLRFGDKNGYSPYDHRKFRHCQEALQEAYEEFEGKYTRDQIKAVFECHVKDDYDGYLPLREDFQNGTFIEKYHEEEEAPERETILSQAELTEYFKGKESHAKSNKAHLSQGFLYRVVAPTILAMVLFISSIFIVVIPFFRNNMLDRKKEMIKELTASAISVIDHYIIQEKKGHLIRAEAQKLAANHIKEMRYGDENKDYFWITDKHPRMIMHPYRQELTGQDLTHYKDSKNISGIYLFMEFVRLVKENGAGYLEYQWQWKDDASRKVPKLSYVRGIPTWNWIIGTGIYINDVEEEISKLTHKLLLVFGLISLGLILILVNVVWQSHNIETNRKRAESGLREAKDRYRALVESSKEGYMLEVEGEIIYSNITVRRLLGYNEDEIRAITLLDMLAEDSPVNTSAVEHISQLMAGKTKSTLFEAQLKSSTGKILDVWISTSRMFFTQKNGHVISIRPITHKEVNSILSTYGATAHNTKDIFASKPVKEIAVSVESSVPEDAPFIQENAPVYAAITELEHTASGTLFIRNSEGNITGKIGYAEIARQYTGLPAELLVEIDNSVSVGHVITTLNRLPMLIREMTNQGVKAQILRTAIGRLFDVAINTFMRLSVKSMGEPPVPFAFLSLGSNARHEMTMFSDQDNALVFADVEEHELDKVRRYFLNLADGVCTKLNQAGYPFCPGGIMAVNPKWCLSLSEWKERFSNWIASSTPESILEVNIFLDIRNVYGDTNLTEEMITYAMGLAEANPQFFIQFARNCLQYKAPLNLLGHLRTGSKDGVKTMNIKGCLKPLEIIARIYALKHGITVPGTLDRLRHLIDKEITNDEVFQEMIFVFNYLWQLRFINQLTAHQELKRVNDELDPKSLSDIERSNLRNVVAKISDFQSRLSIDFLDGVIH
ncbi:MAG: DUF294 nucleotidyltransferase-like domain-containing protein [Candidatus Cloacimonetes bacterium]|nr:DUF294 nucleotidyltransferase-like domain-containing protein [Candidatus Cloacimonadota bacterium]